jgi:hypothetical protein
MQAQTAGWRDGLATVFVGWYGTAGTRSWL